MLYRLFLYKTTAVMPDAPAIAIINDAIGNDSYGAWFGDSADHYMEAFDTDALLTWIRTAFTNPMSQEALCKAIVRYPPAGRQRIGYIYVATSCEKAPEVLPQLSAIAAANDLALYDAETGKTFYRTLIDHTLLRMKRRQQQLFNLILRTMSPLWNIRKLEFFSEGRDKRCAYTVTIKKDPARSFVQRTAQFYQLLSDNLADGEHLCCENKCFTVKGPYYEIAYVLEGYKRSADRVGHMAHYRPQADLIRRSGTDPAFKWMKTCSKGEQADIMARMNFFEMRQRYPNPADRFVASVNITKWQQKQVFDIRYSGIGYYGSEILFSILPGKYSPDRMELSVLRIEEETATFILPFVEDVYPDIYTYYYEENHLSLKMVERIVARLKWAKDLILHDTFSPLLDPYVESFNLSVLIDLTDPDYSEKRNSRRFLYEQRFKVAYLYEVFIRWAEAQLYYYDTGNHQLFRIQGP